jgi:hypothetical protein
MNYIGSNFIGQFWQLPQIPDISRERIIRDIDRSNIYPCSFQIKRISKVQLLPFAER